MRLVLDIRPYGGKFNNEYFYYNHGVSYWEGHEPFEFYHFSDPSKDFKLSIDRYGDLECINGDIYLIAGSKAVDYETMIYKATLGKNNPILIYQSEEEQRVADSYQLTEKGFYLWYSRSGEIVFVDFNGNVSLVYKANTLISDPLLKYQSLEAVAFYDKFIMAAELYDDGRGNAWKTIIISKGSGEAKLSEENAVSFNRTDYERSPHNMISRGGNYLVCQDSKLYEYIEGFEFQKREVIDISYLKQTNVKMKLEIKGIFTLYDEIYLYISCDDLEVAGFYFYNEDEGTLVPTNYSESSLGIKSSDMWFQFVDLVVK